MRRFKDIDMKTTPSDSPLTRGGAVKFSLLLFFYHFRHFGKPLCHAEQSHCHAER